VSRGPRRVDARLERVHRAVASGVGASVDDTIWLVQRVHGLQSLLRAADRALLAISNGMRDSVKLAADCRDGLEAERGS
jgi:hypothetical protein